MPPSSHDKHTYCQFTMHDNLTAGVMKCLGTKNYDPKQARLKKPL